MKQFRTTIIESLNSRPWWPVSIMSRNRSALFIEQVLLALRDEGGKRVLKALLDGARILAGGQAADHVVAADQALVQREVDLAGVERLQGRPQFQAQPGGV